MVSAEDEVAGWSHRRPLPAEVSLATPTVWSGVPARWRTQVVDRCTSVTQSDLRATLSMREQAGLKIAEPDPLGAIRYSGRRRVGLQRVGGAMNSSDMARSESSRTYQN